MEVVLLRKNFQEIWLSLFSKETKVHVFQPESFSSDKLSYIGSEYIDKDFFNKFVQPFSHVAFGSRHNDIFTATCTATAIRKGKLVYQYSKQFEAIDQMALSTNKLETAILKLKSAVLSSVIGARIEIISYNGYLVPCHKIAAEFVCPQDMDKIQDDAKSRFEISGEGNLNVLFLDSPGKQHEIIKDFEQTLTTILKGLSRLSNVYVKPHPINGFSEPVLKLQDELNLIKSHLPTSMISLKNFKAAYTIDSAAIREITQCQPVSVIDCFEYYKKENLLSCKRYLSSNTQQTIVFESSTNLFDSIKGGEA